MNIPQNFNEEVVFSLRSIYKNRGFTQYKMSKFEEYDLYAKNKDFLISEGVITFTDTNGKLMALKPDVTLSIIKNLKDEANSVQKLYYNENVYRISKGSHSFKEIMQVGLECFGDIDNYNISEVITLAVKSLKTVCENCVLDISNLTVLENLISSLGIPESEKQNVLKAFEEKNSHDLKKICLSLGIDSDIFTLLTTENGTPEEFLPKVKEALKNKIDITPLNELEEILSSLDPEIKDVIRIDFSVVSDVNYYNGIVFKGFVEGVPASVLSGGQYNKLMKKMGRKSGAVGFAVYLDMLERLNKTRSDFDVDTVLLYNEETKLNILNDTVKKLSENGSVTALKQIPQNLKYKTLVTLKNGEVQILENNA